MMKKLAITVLVTAGLLLTVEAGLRVWAYFFRHSYQRYDPAAGMIRLVPNYDAERYGGRIKVNSKGFRGPEFSEHKPPGVYRIFALGDSTTFGLSGEGCHYPAKLERLLNGEGQGRHYEVINAGVEGYNSRDALSVLEREVLRYEPDMITIYIGWNDLMKYDPGRPDATVKAARMSYALYNIYIVKLWRKMLFSRLRPLLLRVQTELPDDRARSYERYVPHIFREHLEQIIDTATRRGIRVALLTLPSPLNDHMDGRDLKKLYFPYYTYNLKTFYLVYSKYNATIREMGRRKGVPVLDLQASLNGKSSLFFDTAHMGCEGHDVVAHQLFDGLRNIGVVQTHTANAGGRHGQN